MSTRAAVKVGDLVEVTWEDVCSYNDLAEVEEDVARKGWIMHTIGFVAAISKTHILLCAELDWERKAFRDFNRIPLSIVKRIRSRQ